MSDTACKDACVHNKHCSAWKHRDGHCLIYDRLAELRPLSQGEEGSVCFTKDDEASFDGFITPSLGDVLWEADALVTSRPTTWTRSAKACANRCRLNDECQSFAYQAGKRINDDGVCTLLRKRFDNGSSNLVRFDGSSNTISASKASAPAVSKEAVASQEAS